MSKDELIVCYFNGSLSNEASLQFEHYLETDSDFKDEFEFQNSVKQAFINKEHIKLKEQLQSVENDIDKTKPIKTWWLVAASIAILIFSGLYFFNSDYSSQELFTDYYQAPKNIVHPILRNGDTNNDLTTAFIAYQKQDYKSAEQLFENAYQSTQKSELLFYQAISYIETDRADLAVELLTKHQEFTDDVSEKTQWYLALAYLKQDNSEAAKPVLETIISQQQAFKYKEAKALIKKL